MNVNELEVEIKNVKAKIAKLVDKYEAEEDESKASKLQYTISRQDDILDRLIDRQQLLLDKEEKETLKPGNGNDKNAEEDDEYVCEECGGDLTEVEEEGVYLCEKCGEYYERE